MDGADGEAALRTRTMRDAAGDEEGDEGDEDKATTRDKRGLIEFSMLMTRSAGARHNAPMKSPSRQRFTWLSPGTLWLVRFGRGPDRWTPGSAAIVLGLLLPLPALAWNSAGHRLVACLAWDQLDQHTRTGISQLLHEHPDYLRWRRRAGDGDPDRGVFIEASTWPDDIRQDSRFYSAGVDTPTPTLPGYPDMERRRDWHYVNRPLAESPNGRHLPRSEPRSELVSGRLDRQLVVLTQTLGSSGTLSSERSYALPWLIHLVGDAHQPLHTSLRLATEGRVDHLGNGLTVINPFNPRKSTTTLHAFWDDLPGPPWLRGERLDSACRELAASYPHPAPAASAQWIDESWRIAGSSAYPPGSDTPPTISAQFHDDARAIARRRIADAGYRLADLLASLLGEK